MVDKKFAFLTLYKVTGTAEKRYQLLSIFIHEQYAQIVCFELDIGDGDGGDGFSKTVIT